MRKIRCRNINKILDFWPRWRCRQTHCASSHNQKDNNKFKNKKQPELIENRTVWKSNNQGDKEETLTQTGRRGGDWQSGGEDSQQGRGWQTGQSHIPMQINQEERLGKERDQATQGSIEGKYSLKPLIENTCGGCGGSGRNSQPHRRVPWRDPQGPRMHTNAPTRESAPEGPNLLVSSGKSD